MKKKLNCLILGIGIMGFIACQEKVGNEINSPVSEIKNDKNDNYDIAFEFVKDFSQKLNYKNTKSNEISNLEPKTWEKSTLIFSVNKDNEIIKTRSKTIPNNTNIDIYTFTFMKNGKEGFAIVSPDERIHKVLAYVENGILADTSQFQNVSFMLKTIPNIVANNLNNYYMSNDIESKANDGYYQVSLGSTIKTQWSYDTPYNNKYPTATCTTVGNNKYPASATAVALAQAVVNYPAEYRPSTLTAKYNIKDIIATSKISTTNKNAAKVAELVRSFDQDEIITKFKCNRTITFLSDALGSLEALGFQKNNHYVYSSKEDVLQTLKCLSHQCVCIYAGYERYNANNYFVWLVDGFIGLSDLSYSKYKDGHYHCNFGMGGLYDSWFSSPVYPEWGPDKHPLFNPPFDMNMHFIHIRPYLPGFNFGF